MIPRPLGDIGEADLAALVGNKVMEGKAIEYKSSLPGNSDADKKEFLKDITSFANTEGGDLLYGVATEDGVPIGFPGIGDDAVADQVKLRLESIVRDGLDPRLPHCEIRAVEAFNVTVMAIRVHKSWAAPHRVSFAGHGHFYGRSSAGAYQMDVDQLRNAFTMSAAIEERMRSTRTGRIHQIIARNGTPVPLRPGCCLTLHLLPLSAFSNPSRIDLPSNLESLKAFHPIGSTGHQHSRINLDGLVNHTDMTGGSARAYTQIWRTGMVEAVAALRSSQDERPKLIHAPKLSSFVADVLARYVPLLQRLGFSTPIYVFASLTDTLGFTFLVSGDYNSEATDADRPTYLFPDTVLSSYEQSLDPLLRELLDSVWNAFGYDRCPYFGSDGGFSPPPPR